MKFQLQKSPFEEYKNELMTKGIIFDFNGTMLWDADFHELAWNALAKEVRGSEMTEDELVRHMHGRTNKAITEYVLGRSASVDEVRKIGGRKEALYRDICLQNPSRFRLAPGLENLLNYLSENNIARSIATSSEWENVDFFIQNLDLHRWFSPDQIIYDNGTFRSKPFPDIFEKAAAAMQIAPANCIAIEDSHSGLIAAEEAGIGTVIAISPSGTAMDVSKLKREVTQIYRFGDIDWPTLLLNK